MEQLIRFKQGMTLLNMSECSGYRMIERGELPHVRIGRSIRFRPSDLEKYIADHAVEKAAKGKAASA